jgi:aryl-alcohol dehydrogenase-like predicted oxidoreductase
MSVFASGAIPPEEAIEWVCAQPNVESIVFGASSRRNIEHTRSLVGRHWDLEPSLVA